MLRYRFFRAIARGYPFVVLALYIGAFFIALTLMFVFPPATLLLLGFGLAGLVGVALVGKTLAAVEHLVARRILAGGACPGCGHRMQTMRDAASRWRCEFCEVVFLPGGLEE